MAKQAKKVGKPALSEAEKEARKLALKYESKSDRFLRLGTPRVNKVLTAIDSLTKLSKGKSEYTVQQVEAMLTAIGMACEKLKNAYTRQSSSGGSGFKF
jgi:cytochrome c556